MIFSDRRYAKENLKLVHRRSKWFKLMDELEDHYKINHMKISFWLFILSLLLYANINGQCGHDMMIILHTQAEVDSFLLKYCKEFKGNLRIIGGTDNDDPIVSLHSLEGLNIVEGIFDLQYTSISDLSGLDSLFHVGRMDITGHSNLKSLDGIGKLAYTKGDFFIGGNPLLQNLRGLDNLLQVGGYFHIIGNDNLINLNGLPYIKHIGGLRIKWNPRLKSLQGIANASASTIYPNPQDFDEVSITNNDSLSICDVNFICKALRRDDLRIHISNNAGDCQSVDNLMEACEENLERLPMLKDGARWLIRWHHGISRSSNITLDREVRLTDRDTIIDNKEYKVVESLSRARYTSKTLPPPPIGNPISDTTARYWGAMRENEGKVYLHNGAREKLLYDFTSIINEDVSIAAGGHIIKIDTIDLLGTSRKRYHIRTYREFEYYIYEGIGSTLGLIGSAPYHPSVELICHSNYKTGEVYYISENYDRCYEMQVPSFDPDSPTTFIYPNPAENILNIELSDYSPDMNVEVYDLWGRRLFHQFLRDKTTIDVSHLNYGLYTLKIQSKSRIYLEKFVKM